EYSADGTQQILESYGDRIRVIREHARCVARARNIGLAAARGEYICYCDSDDEQEPNRIAVQAAILDRCPEVALAFCDSFLWEDGIKIASDSLLRSRWIGPTDRSFDDDLAHHFERHETFDGKPLHRGLVDAWLCAIHAAWGHSQMYRADLI